MDFLKAGEAARSRGQHSIVERGSRRQSLVTYTPPPAATPPSSSSSIPSVFRAAR